MKNQTTDDEKTVQAIILLNKVPLIIHTLDALKTLVLYGLILHFVFGLTTHGLVTSMYFIIGWYVLLSFVVQPIAAYFCRSALAYTLLAIGIVSINLFLR